MIKVQITSFFLMVLSLVILLFALVSNPFSIPFQDFNQMPKEQQEDYVRNAELIDGIIVASLGLATASTGVFVCSSYLIFRAKKNSNST